MSIFWSDKVREIQPYLPGEQPKDKKYIKLNTNENPYPPSPKVVEALKNAADGSLRLYPDPDCENLKEAIAGYYEISKSKVFVGNGSDEVLAFAFMAFFNPGSRIKFADITYSFYPVYSELFGIDYSLIQSDGDFNLKVEDYFGDNQGIIIANPNAPTGKAFEIESIERILQMNPSSVVIVDEAYVDFGGESAYGLIDTYPNLLVVQTFSKSRSLAGLRVGFAMGDSQLIEALDRIKNSINSYTLDRLALAGAVEAINDDGYFNETRSRIIGTRDRISKELSAMGFKVLESRTNFIFIEHSKITGKDLFLKLREAGILVRHFQKPRIENYLRVTIGTDEEMDSFIKAVSEMVKN